MSIISKAKKWLGIDREPRVLETLDLDDFTFGVDWEDSDGDVLSLRSGGRVRRTYNEAEDDYHETDDPWWIGSALSEFGPYTEILPGSRK